MITSGDFYKRDYLMLVECVKEGVFREEDIRLLNRIEIHLYKGVFKEILDNESGNVSPNVVQREYMEELKELVSKYII